MGGARVGGAAKDHQLAAAQAPADVLHGAQDVGDVGVLGLGERRGDADVDDVGGRERREVAGGLEPAGPADLLELGGGHVLDVGAAFGEHADLLRVEIEAGDPEARLGELEGEGKPDVAEADDPDVRVARIDAIAKLVEAAHELAAPGLAGGAAGSSGVPK